MDSAGNAGRFDQAVSGLCERLQRVLMRVPFTAKSTACEVRLRVGRNICLTMAGLNWFADEMGRLQNSPQYGFTVTREDLDQSIVRMCSFSLHSHQDEIRNGFISLFGGHRAGLCGTAVLNGTQVQAVRDVTSINVRIARDIKDAALPLVRRVFAEGPCSALIVGAPSSGKTTVLRDLARQLSSGRAGTFQKVAVVDERGEIGAVYEGVPQNDLGPCCDLLSGYPKAEGILTAVRTLSPQIILCDEIGGEAEVAGILDGVNCGVKIVATAHASSLGELLGRRQIRRLLECGVFERIVRLDGAERPGEIVEIVEAGELLAQTDGFRPAGAVLFSDGGSHGRGAYRAGAPD